jgi:hypothetical protein
MVNYRLSVVEKLRRPGFAPGPNLQTQAGISQSEPVMSKSASTIRKESLVSAELARSLLDYNPDTGVLTWKCRQVSKPQHISWNNKLAGKSAGCVTSSHYLLISISDNSYFAHRVAWLIVHGRWPEDQIDHIDHDTLNNRLSNLREVTNTENHRNVSLSKINKSGVSGVYWCKKSSKWHAQGIAAGKRVHIGLFGLLADAAAARKSFEESRGFHKNHGEIKP